MPDAPRSGPDWFLIARIAYAAGGIAVLLWGVRLLLAYPWPVLVSLGVWLLAAVVIHDGVLSPLVLAIAAGLRRLPPRGRRFVQFGLITAFPALVIGAPMIALQGSFPPVKALLEQRYELNLALLLGLVAGGCLVGYAITVAHDRGAASRVPGSRPPAAGTGSDTSS